MRNTTNDTGQLFHEIVQEDSRFLIIPLVVIILIMLLSALVYLMAKKRSQDTLRENLMQLYEFDSLEREWESFHQSYERNYGSVYNYNSTAV
ncbi:uncharacterized protein LOC116181734 [Photinus pyralis]|uniref:uncharacterized protein LOC116181734 n=1 Tax=Photinus pyralis TaxID=7054 RepID=UPI0012677FE7|nr:uncharacterized protein LOC116181734 [Photinus pyralis]